MKDFSGKTVVITGAAGGIGQALARAFGEQGAKIGALDISNKVESFVEGLNSDGIEAVTAVADISSPEQVSAAFGCIRDRFGPVFHLINNAGFSTGNSLETSTPATWQTDISGNLNGAYFCASEALEDMKKSGGSITNVSSVNGLMSLGDPAYSAAKAGMISFTKSVAMEYGRFDIRCNVICPGTVRTPLWIERAKKNPEILSDLVKWYPLQRVVDPEDIANVAVFLASAAARAITGAVIPVDCGFSAGNIIMARELTLEEF